MDNPNIFLQSAVVAYNTVCEKSSKIYWFIIHYGSSSDSIHETTKVREIFQWFRTWWTFLHVWFLSRNRNKKLAESKKKCLLALVTGLSLMCMLLLGTVAIAVYTLVSLKTATTISTSITTAGISSIANTSTVTIITISTTSKFDQSSSAQF